MVTLSRHPGSHHMNHMAKRQMDHMNHIAKEITWKRKSHDKRSHMTRETREITWQEKSHGKKTNGKGEKESEASDGNSCCSIRAILLAPSRTLLGVLLGVLAPTRSRL